MAGGTPQIDRAARGAAKACRGYSESYHGPASFGEGSIYGRRARPGVARHIGRASEKGLRKRNVDTHRQIPALIDSNFSEAIEAPNAKLPWPGIDANLSAPQIHNERPCFWFLAGPLRVVFTCGATSSSHPTRVELDLNGQAETCPIPDDRSVKLTVELPAAVHRDLVAYAEVFAQEHGQTVEPVKLVPSMLARFMSTDRVFARVRRAKSSAS
jgi:hypothetical protein